MVFAEGKERSAVGYGRCSTELTELFKASGENPKTRLIRHDDFPKYFTRSTGTNCWKQWSCPRRRSRLPEQGEFDFSGPAASVVGHISTVSSRESERYFLGLLLTQVFGAVSYRDLRSAVGMQCAGSGAAPCRLGLLVGDNEWRNALREFFRSTFVPLTRFSASVLAYCERSHPLAP